MILAVQVVHALALVVVHAPWLVLDPGNQQQSLLQSIGLYGNGLKPVACTWYKPDTCTYGINNPLGWGAANLLSGPWAFLSFAFLQLMAADGISLSKACQPGDFGASCVYYRLWQIGLGLGYAILAVAVVARAFRAFMDSRGSAGQAIVHSIVRAVVVAGLMQLSYTAIAFLSDESLQLYPELFQAFTLGYSSWNDPAQTFVSFGAAYSAGPWLIIPWIANFFGVAWVTFLLTLARLVLLFGTAIAPMVIALTVFSESLDVVKWWSKMMLGAVLTPIVAGIIMGITSAIVFSLVPNFTNLADLGCGVGHSGSCDMWEAFGHVTLHDYPANLLFMGCLAILVQLFSYWFIHQAIKHVAHFGPGNIGMKGMLMEAMAMKSLGTSLGAVIAGQDGKGGLLGGAKSGLTALQSDLGGKSGRAASVSGVGGVGGDSAGGVQSSAGKGSPWAAVAPTVGVDAAFDKASFTNLRTPTGRSRMESALGGPAAAKQIYDLAAATGGPAHGEVAVWEAFMGTEAGKAHRQKQWVGYARQQFISEMSGPRAMATAGASA